MARLFLETDNLVDISDASSLGQNIIVTDISDVSGSSTSDQTAQATEQIEEFASEGGGLLAVPYGLHVIAGHLIAYKFVPGVPDTAFILIALGDGQGRGGLHGEWHAVLKVWYAGQELSVSPDGATAGYRFHNGQISTGIADPNQAVDAFLSGGIAYNGTPNVAIKLSGAMATEQRPERIRVLVQTRRTFDHDERGNVTNYGYFAAPATIAADVIRGYYERRPRDDLNAFDRFQKKINWLKWREWTSFNGAGISWDPGTGAITIARFDCHLALTDEAILADVLDRICAACCGVWQEDGNEITFLPPTDRDPVHHFHVGNMIDGSVHAESRDLRNQPNLFVAEFRDVRDPFLGKTSVEVKRQDLINQMGEIKTVQALPGMERSQAQRILEYRARLECDNPILATFVGDDSSLHVLQGDYVTVTHPLMGWDYQRCYVHSVVVNQPENSADTCEFVVQAINGSLYSDTAHGPRQEALTP
jgi:hypothetical protein